MRHLALVGLVLACTPNSPAATPAKTVEPPAKTVDSPAKTVEPTPDAKVETPTQAGVDDERWRCAKDDDCTQTCALGAVNTAWLAAHPDADACDDGCGWKSGQEACRDGACVTLDEKGGIDPSCTKRDRPMFE